MFPRVITVGRNIIKLLLAALKEDRRQRVRLDTRGWAVKIFIEEHEFSLENYNFSFGLSTF